MGTEEGLTPCLPFYIVLSAIVMVIYLPLFVTSSFVACLACGKVVTASYRAWGSVLQRRYPELQLEEEPKAASSPASSCSFKVLCVLSVTLFVTFFSLLHPEKPL
jgi:hypothetical protein